MPTFGPVFSPVTQSVIEEIGSTRFDDAFHPATLFAGDIAGLALDLTAASLLYQDSARTTPVTGTGQPIGSPSDISGNGNHPTQATAANRPTFDGWATFDGSNDAWATAAINFGATDKVTIVVGARPNASAGAAAMAVELSATTVSNTASFHLTVPNSATGVINAARRGSGSRGDRSTPGNTLPANLVVSTTFDLAGATQATECPYIRLNAVAATLVDGGSADTGGGNFGNYPLYIGARGGTTLPFNGRMYRLIVIGRTLTALELAEAERWCAQPQGLFF